MRPARRLLGAALLLAAAGTVAPRPAYAQEWVPFPTPELTIEQRERGARPAAPRPRPVRPAVVREKAASADERVKPESAPRVKAPPRPIVEVVTETLSVDAVIERLRKPSLAFVDTRGALFEPDARRRSAGAAEPAPMLSEPTVVEALRGASLTADQAITLWTVFSDKPYVTPAIVEALIGATRTPAAGELMWEALADAASSSDGVAGDTAPLLGVLERHRKTLLPLLAGVPEPQNADDDIMTVVMSSRVFGATQHESIVYMAGQKPGTVARRIERERELGKPAWWEYTAFMEMMRWRNARLLPNAPKAPATLAEFDATAETFVTVFNCLHGLDNWYRDQMMQGLGPADLFNIVVSGEQELYRLGTSGYRQHLHPTILRGIRESRSLEAFVQRTSLERLGASGVEATGRRALVFLRIASSFGLLDSVIETIRDRDGFVADAIAALGNPLALEGSGAVVTDLLTARSSSPVVVAFKQAVLDQLYDRYRRPDAGASRIVYGGILATYQAVTGDRRDASIDRSFPVDRAMFDRSFETLFVPDGRGKPTHRMFMRFDEDVDAVRTHASFRRMMQERGAQARSAQDHEVHVLSGRGRTIEIYVNKPTARGVRYGIADIARELEGLRVETVIGRGHTGIISPLQRDARRILGPRVKDVALVIVGTCGGNASVRQLIDTFGYVPVVASKSTGRLLLNNAIIEAYIDALLAVSPSDRLSLQPILERAMAPFMAQRDSDLREDAKLYVVNISTVLSAYIYDRHVRRAQEYAAHP